MKSASPLVVAVMVLGWSTGCCGDDGGLWAANRATGTLILPAAGPDDEPAGESLDMMVSTEVMVLRSRAIVGQAQQCCGIVQPFGTDDEAAIRGLMEALEVRRVDESLVIEVSVGAEDSEAATTACNCVMEAYLDHRRRQRTDAAEQSVVWLDEQIGQLQAELELVPADDVTRSGQVETLLEQLQQRSDEARLESALTTADALVLEPCRAPGP